MSTAYYNTEGLRFYDEEEINLREMMISKISETVKRTLLDMNPAWKFYRTEGPILTPGNYVSSSYDTDDIFVTQVDKNGYDLVLRPETTQSSYEVARKKYSSNKLPLCIWQAGKSFRVEKSDGATAAKLRFNEFWQLEFQCIYSIGTKADYRSKLIEAVSSDVRMFLFNPICRVVESDRLPSYSESTIDIEVMNEEYDRYVEIASCSTRTDFSEETRVCEIAIGLDRLVNLYGKFK